MQPKLFAFQAKRGQQVVAMSNITLFNVPLSFSLAGKTRRLSCQPPQELITNTKDHKSSIQPPT